VSAGGAWACHATLSACACHATLSACHATLSALWGRLTMPWFPGPMLWGHLVAPLVVRCARWRHLVVITNALVAFRTSLSASVTRLLCVSDTLLHGCHLQDVHASLLCFRIIWPKCECRWAWRPCGEAPTTMSHCQRWTPQSWRRVSACR